MFLFEWKVLSPMNPSFSHLAVNFGLKKTKKATLLCLSIILVPHYEFIQEPVKRRNFLKSLESYKVIDI